MPLPIEFAAGVRNLPCTAINCAPIKNNTNTSMKQVFFIIYMVINPFVFPPVRSFFFLSPSQVKKGVLKYFMQLLELLDLMRIFILRNLVERGW